VATVVAIISAAVALIDRRAPKKNVLSLPRIILLAALTQAAALGAGGLCGAWVNVACALVAGLCGFVALSARGPRTECAAVSSFASMAWWGRVVVETRLSSSTLGGNVEESTTSPPTPRRRLAEPLLAAERRPRLAPPALLLFLLEAMPSMDPTLGNVEYWLLFARKPCATPLLSLASVAASLLACGAYGLRKGAQNDRAWVALTTFLSALASVPRAGLNLLRPLGVKTGGQRQLWGLGRIDVVLLTKRLASFFGEGAVLASSTFALRLAAQVPGVTRGRTYGALLSLFDAGGAASAALSAALASGVAYGVWDGLARLVYICAAVAVHRWACCALWGDPRATAARTRRRRQAHWGPNSSGFCVLFSPI